VRAAAPDARARTVAARRHQTRLRSGPTQPPIPGIRRHRDKDHRRVSSCTATAPDAEIGEPGHNKHGGTVDGRAAGTGSSPASPARPRWPVIRNCPPPVSVSRCRARIPAGERPWLVTHDQHAATGDPVSCASARRAGPPRRTGLPGTAHCRRSRQRRTGAVRTAPLPVHRRRRAPGRPIVDCCCGLQGSGAPGRSASGDARTS
jgi:hypothetical protein